MKFGATPIADCEGALLAHSLRENGVNFKKGHRLSSDDLRLISMATARETLIVARLEDDDVDEDTAAGRLAQALAGHGASAAEPFTGRANLYAQTAGLFRIDRERLTRLNAIHESLTLATLEDFESVDAGQMLATMKIIPFATPFKALENALSIIGEASRMISIIPYKPHSIGLIATTLPSLKTSVLDKTRKGLDARVSALGSVIAEEIRCPHDEEHIAQSISQLAAKGLSPIFVFGASATVDRRDVVPAGIVGAGGEIVHFGMPVDPGNLLVLGRLNDTPVVGLPGCARSPKLNGFDWVMARLLAGQEVTGADIQAMGHGGLLKEISTRPQPRENHAHEPRAAKIAAIVLAGGQSRRMGEQNKLLAELGGKPLVAHAVESALGASTDRVIVVTGHEADEVRSALDGYRVTFTHNPAYADGLSTSLKAGIAALPPSTDGAVILLGDMPDIDARLIDRLIAAFDPDEGREIVVPTAHGKPGNPVLWGAAYFEEMQALKGDQGAKRLINEHADKVCEIDIGQDAIHLDIDTSEALAARRG